jgi:hypothetical protein
MRAHESHAKQTAIILLVVFGIFALHTSEIWLYAIAYRILGEIRGFEEALYSPPNGPCRHLLSGRRLRAMPSIRSGICRMLTEGRFALGALHSPLRSRRTG